VASLGLARGDEIEINGIPYWCPQFDSTDFAFYLSFSNVTGEISLEDKMEINSFELSSNYIAVVRVLFI
jgi:hypothetical protein